MGMFYSCPTQETIAVIERFGKYNRMASPGFNCVHCYIGEAVSGGFGRSSQASSCTRLTKLGTRPPFLRDCVVEGSAA
jgi:hypothetical protein